MNGRELTDSLEIANEFNIFFANVGVNSSVADATGVDNWNTINADRKLSHA